MARTNIVDRIKEFVTSQKLPMRKFEERCGFSSGYIRLLKHSPSQGKLDAMFTAFPDLRKEYILYGEEPMLKSEVGREVKAYKPYGVVNIPIVSQYAYAGYLAGYADEGYLDSMPTIPFLADHEMSGNYVAFEIKGDSMDDGSKEGYVEGETVICREVEPYLYKENKLFIDKRDFVIVHKEGILIKRIIEHDVSGHKIRIHSLNPEYRDRTLNLADVKQIFSIIASQMQRKR